MATLQARDKSDKSESKREALLDAAAGVFLRYGHKKTSMDDLARAAGLSRQGLYGHFDGKDVLFKAAVVHVVDKSVGAAVACLDGDGDVADVVVDGFTALHGIHFHQPIASEHMAELLEAARAVGVDVEGAQRPFSLALARLLVRRCHKKPKEAADVGAVLEAASLGLKHSVPDVATFRARMFVVVKVVLPGAKP